MQVTKLDEVHTPTSQDQTSTQDPIIRLQSQMDQLFSMIGKSPEQFDTPEDHMMAGMVSSFAFLTNSNINAWVVDT